MNILNKEFLSKEELMKNLLFPMFHCLDEKNIIDGVTIKIENEKLYICISRNSLSSKNQKLLEIVSRVYSTTIFYSDNEQSPNLDRLEYWCPDKKYDEMFHITEKIRNKKMFVLELDANDYFTILGASLMLAQTLQEQDPLDLKGKVLKDNEKVELVDENILNRHNHYIADGYPDLKWLELRVILDKNNPLKANEYAYDLPIAEINSPVYCDNLFGMLAIGGDEKKRITFCMDKEYLDIAIADYFEKHDNTNPVIKTIYYEKHNNAKIETKTMKKLKLN